jgi:L-ascorbate metabolism protein UlaG (beta-lactamase superfamily)
MRMPWDRNEMLWGGFVIRSPQGVAYHAGDTGYFDGFADIAKNCGTIDWAMLPIGAYEPRWFMHPQHMDPDESVRAFDLLQARFFVPMHWGTFRLTDEPVSEPLARIKNLWQVQGRDPSRLWAMNIGETRSLL